MIMTTLQLISVWKKVPLCSLLYYLLLTAGYSITMVSIKLFITVSMMIGNIIDIYLSGIMIVLINWLMYSGYFGLILCSYLLYLFLTRMELFLIISFMLESFFIISQSLIIYALILILDHLLNMNVSYVYINSECNINIWY